ncbi:DUF5906 domain-containing protein [Pseudomonas umsongensis]|uniref:DUF5906 domain-containing protein n=1 Tax=Pseudomonas umsongensis TaxID=198618 RepID=UPI00200AECD1|nr:DUF5906 domain-containing protein [Pseudomonas umsongensis]MCK8687850.1 DUF5906 domain-containing protein [Pseudomonas umsongensis]
MNAAIDELMTAMREHGIEPSDPLKMDGTLERFHVMGDRKGSTNGWAKIHLDAKPAGNFGCMKRWSGHKFPWKAKRDTKPMSATDLKAQREDWARRKAEQAAATDKRHADAAQRAQALWSAAQPAPDNHPYLVRKGVKAHGLRMGVWELINKDTGEVWSLTSKALYVPLCDKTRAVQSLQGIFPGKILGKGDGARDKDYLKDGAKRGLFHAIGKPQQFDGRPVFIICEGYATGATLHEATNHLVLVTFDTSNLLAVGEAIRESKPDAIILFAADNDQWTVTPTMTNPGLHFARAAAKDVGALVAVPPFDFSEGTQDAEGKWSGPTDFNDLAARDGNPAVAAIIEAVLVARQVVQDEPELVTESSCPVIDDAPPFEGKHDLQQESVSDEQQSADTEPYAGRDEARRRVQREENERLQNDEFGEMFPAQMELNEMLQNLVWVAEGEQVAYVTPTSAMFLTFKEVRGLTANSTTCEPSKGKKKPILNAVLWQKDPERRNVMTRTFRAGAGHISADPDGRRAANTWRPKLRWDVKADIDLFLEHVEYLFADATERNAFFDWLAHLEQKPGELPHYGWLHVANRTGCGRNWLASVLARVWRGYVAPNVDLPSLLDSAYNGCLSGRVLAIVDEVQEGAGENSYRHTNKLRSLVNAEYRDINPKFGRQYREYNACRWLVFSNHLNALPIGDTDRRWRVMVHNDAPRSPETYAQLYAALNDSEFINAVAMFLKTRDISQFKPGERPPMNSAKLSVVDASKSLTQHRADEIVERWPTDIITNTDAAFVMSEGLAANITNSMRRSLEELGAINIRRQIKIGGKGQRLWIIRNHAQWAEQDNTAVVAEQQKARFGLHLDADAMFVLAESRHGQQSHDDSDEHPFD